MKLTKEEGELIQICHRDPFEGGLTLHDLMIKNGFSIIDMKYLIRKLAPKAPRAQGRRVK